MMAMPKTSIASESPKGREILRNMALGLDAAGLDEAGLQRVVERARELQKGSTALVTDLSITDRYKNQEVASNWTYPAEYGGPKELHAQLELLVGILPGLDVEQAWTWYNDVYTKLEVPDWVEGVFAVPSEFALGRLFHPDVANRAASYCTGARLLMEKLAASRTFYNYREGQIVPAHLWRTERTTEKLDALWEMQGKPDTIILPAQVGMRHRGRSVLRACECFVAQEFGGGSLEGLAVALTHPERFVRWEQLHMDLPGDDFSSEAGGRADETPCMCFSGGRVEFSAFNRGNADGLYGSMSCWLPPQ
jgi:hypothetical protein